jgi:hypothetical protein
MDINSELEPPRKRDTPVTPIILQPSLVCGRPPFPIRRHHSSCLRPPHHTGWILGDVSHDPLSVERLQGGHRRIQMRLQLPGGRLRCTDCSNERCVRDSAAAETYVVLSIADRLATSRTLAPGTPPHAANTFPHELRCSMLSETENMTGVCRVCRPAASPSLPKHAVFFENTCRRILRPVPAERGADRKRVGRGLVRRDSLPTQITQ